MKILIDAHLSENKITGIGRYLNCLISELTNLDLSNEYIILINNHIKEDHPLKTIQSPNIKTITVNLKGPTFKQNVIIPGILKKHNPDVYHHPHFDLPFFINTPSVITVHDLKYIKHPEFFSKKQKLKSTYMKLMLKSTLGSAAKIVTVSENTKKDLIALYNLEPEKIQVIYHGYKQFYLQGFEENSLEKLGIRNPYILFVGERRPHKNIENLILAFHKFITTKNCGIQLVIVGKKYADYTKPEQLIKNLQRQDKVILTDSISDVKLAHLYTNAAMFILPSLYEGFGMPLLEAMNCGVPVLGSNTTSIPEIIKDAGLLFNPQNIDEITKNMGKVLKNKKIRNTLIEKGYKRIKEFSWKKAASQTLEMYHQVAAVRKQT